ncbi:hypothetical protein DdX_22147 [Ditylenchus destructor]|uniref:RxLR effector protein n=1 Tax=Ditylenchus destructor TaxID=166010 RepID=A0AAD4MEH6_9BILA|nr:hypothetical protein DdX_22147 [Ditylenchus destructor]
MVLKLTIVLQTLLLLDYVLAAPVAVTVNVMDKQRRKQFLLSGVDDEKTVGEIKDEVLGQRDITGQPKLPNATFEPGAKSLVNESFADDTKLKQFIRRIPLRTVKVNVD